MPPADTSNLNRCPKDDAVAETCSGPRVFEPARNSLISSLAPPKQNPSVGLAYRCNIGWRRRLKSLQSASLPREATTYLNRCVATSSTGALKAFSRATEDRSILRVCRRNCRGLQLSQAHESSTKN